MFGALNVPQVFKHAAYCSATYHTNDPAARYDLKRCVTLRLGVSGAKSPSVSTKCSLLPCSPS